MGSTRIRIRTKNAGTTCGSPCGLASDGEVEDYTVIINRASNIWQGNTANWSTASNWSKVYVPTSSFNITIPSTPAGGNFPEISLSTSATCNNLTIESGANVKVYGSLTVNGILTNNAGTSGLVVKSDASGTGSLIANTSNVQATVERYLTGGKWHLFGAPVANQTANALFFNHNPDVWLKTYLESTDSWSATISDMNTPLPMGKGFAVWVKTGFNATASFKNQLNNSDFSITGLTYSGSSYGYNLVANPFASAIDWDQGSWVRTNLDGSVWVYDPIGKNYKTRNSVGAGNLTEGIIPSSQAFFVRATSPNGAITVPANARVPSNISFYKNGDNTQEDNTDFTVAAIEVSKESKKDETWFIFNEVCSDGLDNGWDVSKFFGDADAPQLYAVENGQYLSIDALPALNKERVVLLNFQAGEDGRHYLSLKKYENFDGEEIWLEDLKDEVWQDLTQSQEYAFDGYTLDNPDRFLLHFNPRITGIGQNAESRYSIYSWNKSVYVESPDNTSNTAVEIVDMYGRIIYKGLLKPASLNKIDLNLSNSYLIVRLTGSGNVSVQKIFIH